MSKWIKIISVLLIGLVASINTVTARFMSMDPAAVNPNDPASFNRYAYANNNPYRYVDPDGRHPLILWGIGVGLMVGDMAANEPVPGHEQDGIAPVITLPGPLKLGSKVAAETAEQGSKIVTKGVDDLFKAGRTPKASELTKYAEQQGWKPSQTANGPLKYIDENGVNRLTIKQGSSRAPGSANPHVELRNASGQRVDPAGNPVTRKSPGNHTPIDFDL